MSPDGLPDQKHSAGQEGNASKLSAQQPTSDRSQTQIARSPRPHFRTRDSDRQGYGEYFGHSSANPQDQLSPDVTDRVFPIRSAVSVDPNPTPSHRPGEGGYFNNYNSARRSSIDSRGSKTPAKSRSSTEASRRISMESSDDLPDGPRPRSNTRDRKGSDASAMENMRNAAKPRASAQMISDLAGSKRDSASDRGTSIHTSEGPPSSRAPSFMSTRSGVDENGGGLLTSRFKHVVSEGGHCIITGRDGETLQRCEDEPIHIPGAVQGFGLLIALEEETEGKLIVRIVSENSKRLIGYTPRQLFALDSFTDILSEEQADNLLDHIDFIRDEDADVTVNGPEVFTISIRSPARKSQKLWCAMHVNDKNPGLIICEFELEDDPVCPLVPPNDGTPEPPEDTLESNPTPQEYADSTQNISRPLRVLRSARKRKGEAAAMEVFNIMSQVQEQLAAAPSLDKFLKVLVGVVKELTGFHRVMIYQFDQAWNGRVVTELVDPRATKDLYKGLNFPASDIPKQARELYKLNKVRMLYDRDNETARLVCRTAKDLETPLDLTYSYLRAMSPIHLKYLANMAVRSSMSISINAFDELWGLIACHSYGSKGMRVSFPIRKMCRLVGDSASRNIERLSYASRLQARKLINTVPSQNNPSGYIIASSEDLLKLFDADCGLLSIRDETKILGHLEQSQEALAMLEYLRMRRITNVMTSQDIKEDFPDLRYAPGFKFIAGLLLVPLSSGGQDFIVFFRAGQTKEVKWAGNPYEKFVKEGTEGYLEPRKSFKTWSEMVVGKCREWSEEEIETAAVLCLVYGKFIEVWRQKEAALQNSQLTRLLLANSAHEVRTPLNAIINYLEIALEGQLDNETRENLSKSHSASKSLIYVINDLLDLTKTEEGGDLTKDEEFDLRATLQEATEPYRGDARRKQINYEVIEDPGLPNHVMGDQRKVRQAISNITANAIQFTSQGGVTVEMYVASRAERHVDVECSVSDTGTGIDNKHLDALFRELEQVQTEGDLIESTVPDQKKIEGAVQKEEEKRIIGLGLAVVARIIRNMNGQMRLKSEEGKGSRFVLSFPFELADSEEEPKAIEGSSKSHETAHHDRSMLDDSGEVTLIDRDNTTTTSLKQTESKTPISRKNSHDSMNSKHSLGSMKSGRSGGSDRSEAERLIDAIQEPHMVGTHSKSSSRKGSGGSNRRPQLLERHSMSSAMQGPRSHRQRSHSIEQSVPEHRREIYIGPPGQANVPDQRTPIHSIRVPDGYEGYPPTAFAKDDETSAPRVLGNDDVQDEPPEVSDKAPTADNMRVLIAEDDPVNSRIIKKRLEKLGHEAYLTVNGEECSSTFGEKSGWFDVVLMDMQMPIVDGLTSTKMIRSFEKSHPSHMLSTRASLNGRIPIIAVSASLLERERQIYVDAGFDGWILKPISFQRLQEIMTGIVSPEARNKNVYKKGSWEQGGWFEASQKDVYAADTTPADKYPMTDPSEGVKVAAASDDPAVKEEDESRQTQEQKRMLAEQEKQNNSTEAQEGEEEKTQG